MCCSSPPKHICARFFSVHLEQGRLPSHGTPSFCTGERVFPVERPTWPHPSMQLWLSRRTWHTKQALWSFVSSIAKDGRQWRVTGRKQLNRKSRLQESGCLIVPALRCGQNPTGSFPKYLFCMCSHSLLPFPPPPFHVPTFLGIVLKQPT